MHVRTLYRTLHALLLVFSVPIKVSAGDMRDTHDVKLRLYTASQNCSDLNWVQKIIIDSFFILLTQVKETFKFAICYQPSNIFKYFA